MLQSCSRKFLVLISARLFAILRLLVVFLNTFKNSRPVNNLGCSPFFPNSFKFSSNIIILHFRSGGPRWCSWLRHCATSWKVADSIPNGVTGIFHWHNPSGRNMALGLTQPLTEMSTRNISWKGKGGRCVGLTTLPPSCAECLEIWKPQPPGTLRAYPGL